MIQSIDTSSPRITYIDAHNEMGLDISQDLYITLSDGKKSLKRITLSLYMHSEQNEIGGDFSHVIRDYLYRQLKPTDLMLLKTLDEYDMALAYLFHMLLGYTIKEAVQEVQGCTGDSYRVGPSFVERYLQEVTKIIHERENS